MGKLNAILKAGEKPVMGIYLHVIALVFLAFSAYYFANLLGYGDTPLDKITPVSKIAGIVYAQLFAVSALGLWKRRPWGVACFFIALISQLVLYGGFPEVLTQVKEGEPVFQGIINIHISLLAIFFIIRIKGQ